ncbi:alcohol dehydrogenase catalytic domain-containing protein [Actinosynnema sp. CA-248983]
MRAAVIPEPGAAYEVQSLLAPQPGAGQVLISVRASGICHDDVLAAKGVIGFPSVSPAVLGHEVVGEILSVGEGVTTRRPGDRVGTTRVQSGCGRCDYCMLELPVTGQTAINCVEPRTLGSTMAGGHAEYVVAEAAATVLLPDVLSFELAAPVMCAGYTSWSALRRADPRPHERVAVLGIGGLGHMAVQYSRACGFFTIAITHTADKHDRARELGADVVVSNGRELREAGGADVVLVTGNSHAAASDALLGLRPDGRMVLAGIDGGAGFDLTADRAKPFSGQRHHVMGATHGGPHLLREALDMVASGRVTPAVEVYPLERISDAMDAVAKGEVRFRAVVTP